MDETENKIKKRTEELSAHSGPQSVPTFSLIQQITDDAKDLVKMEIELAKAEAKVDASSEIDLAKGAVVAAICGIMGLNMLLMSAVFAFAPDLGWLAALIVGLVLLAIGAVAAFVGWRRAEKNPLGITRESIQEDIEWAKQQIK